MWLLTPWFIETLRSACMSTVRQLHTQRTRLKKFVG